MAAQQPSPVKTSNADSTSMSMDDYLAKTESNSHSQSSHSSNAYSGSMEGYLAKFGNGEQTQMSENESDPFQTKDHMGFHGSYEEYAKKFN